MAPLRTSRRRRADRRLRLARSIASALLVALGLPRADPVVGFIITLVILKITWDSWRLVSATEPGHTHLHDH